LHRLRTLPRELSGGLRCVVLADRVSLVCCSSLVGHRVFRRALFANCAVNRRIVSGLASAAGVNGTNSMPAPSPSAVQYDQRFLMNMIDHHQMAVEMSVMCLAKAVHTELVQLCQSIIAAQSQEIARMQQWVSHWYGITYQPTMKSGDQQMVERMAAMSGAEFEVAFMEMMITHHARAIREGEQCLKKAYHAALIELCHDIIATQSAEIAQMEAWLCGWYGRC
jgi:uncharacterized protein (DUF305 family)